MYYIVYNPKAGNGRGKKVMDKVRSLLQRNSIPFTEGETLYRHHATLLTKQAIEKGFQNIISIGGDGTILEVVNGMVGSEARLGIIPGGTGNDFIRALGIPNNPEKALEIILRCPPKQVDVATINDHCFMNVAGIGFDVEVLNNSHKFKKYLKGKLSYLIAVFFTVLRYKAQNVRVEIEGKILRRKILLISIGNGKFFGGGMKVLPHASVFDQLLDVCVISDVPKWKILLLLPEFISGNHIKERFVEYFHAKKVKIETENPMQINIDGDIIGETPINCELFNKPLMIFSP